MIPLLTYMVQWTAVKSISTDFINGAENTRFRLNETITKADKAEMSREQHWDLASKTAGNVANNLNPLKTGTVVGGGGGIFIQHLAQAVNCLLYTSAPPRARRRTPHAHVQKRLPRFLVCIGNMFKPKNLFQDVYKRQAQASAVLPLPEDGAASIHSIIRNSP